MQSTSRGQRFPHSRRNRFKSWPQDAAATRTIIAQKAFQAARGPRTCARDTRRAAFSSTWTSSSGAPSAAETSGKGRGASAGADCSGSDGKSASEHFASGASAASGMGARGPHTGSTRGAASLGPSAASERGAGGPEAAASTSLDGATGPSCAPRPASLSASGSGARSA